APQRRIARLARSSLSAANCAGIWWTEVRILAERAGPAPRLAGNMEDDMQYFQTPEMKALGLPFSAAIRVGDLLYLSGALGNVPGTLTLAEGGMAGQARQTMENIGAVLRFCGLGFDDVIKCTVMLADMSEW